MGGQANTGSLFGFTNVKGANQSVVSPNSTAGFSIVSYTRNSDSVTTVGHGLSKTPKVLIEKDRDTASTNWSFITTAIDGTDDYAFLNLTNAFTALGATEFTTTTFRSSMGANQGDIIAYVFAEIEGYSKFGSYIGNGSTDGTFVYTGFRPSFFMTKPSSTTGEWTMYDNTRDTFNVADRRLIANDTGFEYNNGNGLIDFLSNGFKMRVNHPSNNTSGVTYLYMAFAENPLVTSTGEPVTAR
jgi:hypothetical protein